MIELVMQSNGGVGLLHTLARPAVYLDHVGYIMFAEDRASADRFARALEVRGGALMISWVNVAEFAKARPETAAAAEEFIERLLPRLGFLEGNPFTVMQREADVRAHMDFALLGVFANLASRSTQPFTARGLLTVVPGQGLERLTSWSQAFVDQAKKLRDEYATNEEFAQQVESVVKQSGRESATLVVLREVTRTLMRNQSRIEPNDAQDFFHMIVPLVYCDYVLLDKHWEEQIKTVRRRLDRAKSSVQLAQAFSPTDDGIERFLTALERPESRSGIGERVISRASCYTTRSGEESFGCDR
jgi:hypothetical protein